MAAQTDLWGEIALEPARTPVVILREQAALLAKKTNGIVEARVSTSVVSARLVHRFSLVVPALEDYTYELFYISQGANIYPVETSRNTRPGMIPIEGADTLLDEEAFVDWLRTKLSSEGTKKIINNLVAQANS